MGMATNPVNSPGGSDRDKHDYERLRHARERSVGFPVGQYLQPPPMLFTRDGHNAFLGDMYRGQSAFLICGGPSLTSHELTLLSNRGILTMAVNNAATVVRPNLWCSVDDPGNFSDAIWYDAGITKFVPLCHMEKAFVVRDANGDLVDSTHTVGDMPAVFGYRRNEAFVPEQFLTEDTFNWGNHGDRVDSLGNKGSRSVMLVAIRLLHYLGVRTVYLIGCDFRMQTGTQNYAFPQDRTNASVRGNNDSYRIMNSRLGALLPHFEKAGFHVFNCTPNSGLTVFPKKTYEEAIEAATAHIPNRINTEGMYDRNARKSKGKARSTQNSVDPAAVDTSVHLEDLPGMTLVVPINDGELEIFQQSWPTWTKLKPWIAQFPLLVARHPRVAERSIAEIFDGKHEARIETLMIDPTLASPWDRAKVVDIAHRIETEWYWMLEPSAIATSRMDWLSPQVFAKDETDREPVFTACRWGYVKPASIYRELDAWADGTDLFRETPRLDWRVENGADRIQHDAISSWSFLVNTRWAKEIAATVGPETPISEHAPFMLFCAERQRIRFNRIPMKKFGWDHSFGWDARHVKQRSREVLAAK